MKNKKIIIPASVILSLSLIGYFTYSYIKNSKNDNQNTSKVDYGPPTKEEKKYSEDNKQKIEDKEKKQREGVIKPLRGDQQTQTGSTSKKDTTVIITDASQYGDSIEIRAFMPDAYEDGTCTIDIKNGNNEIKKQASAYKDISTTICTNPDIKRSEFPFAGDWVVVVSYVSATFKGTSSPQTIKIE